MDFMTFLSGKAENCIAPGASYILVGKVDSVSKSFTQLSNASSRRSASSPRF